MGKPAILGGEAFPEVLCGARGGGCCDFCTQPSWSPSCGGYSAGWRTLGPSAVACQPGAEHCSAVASLSSFAGQSCPSGRRSGRGSGQPGWSGLLGKAPGAARPLGRVRRQAFRFAPGTRAPAGHACCPGRHLGSSGISAALKRGEMVVSWGISWRSVFGCIGGCWSETGPRVGGARTPPVD